MTEFKILYLSAAVLELSGLLALVTIAIWALNEWRLSRAPRFGVMSFVGANDEANIREAPQAPAHSRTEDLVASL
jgi:hypothetical protein